MSAVRAVRRVEVAGRRLVVKSALGGSRQLVRREAELLDRLRGAGVVEVVTVRETDDRTDLVMDDGGDHTLTDAARLGPEIAMRALRDCARSVDALHRGGWTHGALCSDHVVVDPLGRGRLCSIGSAAPTGRAPHRFDAPDDELRELTDLIVHVEREVGAGLDPWGRVRWRRRTRDLRRRIRVRTREVGNIPAAEAADLIDRIIESDRGRHTTPRVWQHTPRMPVLQRPTMVLLAVGLVAATTALALGARSGEPTAAPLSSASPSGPAPIPDRHRTAPADDDIAVQGTMIRTPGRAYRVGADGDRVRVEDWNGDGDRTALLLRPSSGVIVEFDRWAEPGRPETGRVLARVDDAVDLQVRSSADGSARPLVVRSDGSSVDPMDASDPGWDR